MTGDGVTAVAEALGRELTLAIERLCLYARMLEGASRRVTRMAQLADPSRDQNVERITEQIRRGAADLSGALVSVLEENGRVDALMRSRALLRGASDERTRL